MMLESVGVSLMILIEMLAMLFLPALSAFYFMLKSHLETPVLDIPSQKSGFPHLLLSLQLDEASQKMRFFILSSS